MELEMHPGLPDIEALRAKLLSWYRANARQLPWRKDRDPYHVWVSEIMLQQTRVEAVMGYYARFLAALPNLQALAAVDDETLLKLWEGLGYYSRARNLKKAATEIMTRHGGVFPQTQKALLALSGIGAYTAGAIASICFGQPTPAVDGNVLRVFARLTEMEAPIDRDATKKAVTAALLPLYAPGDCGTLTQALMELGACVCTPNGTPKCDACPLRDLCRAAQNNSWKRFPVRGEKKARRQQKKQLLLLQCGERFALEKRGDKGLLAGLWQFPNADTDNTDPQAALDAAAARGAAPIALQAQTSYVHVFTHIEWHITAFWILCRNEAPGLTWVTAEQLETQYALPSAFKPAWDIRTAFSEG